MKYLIVFILCMLAASKMSIQGGFGRNNVKNSSDALIFNGFVFVFSSAIFLPDVFGCSDAVWVYAVIAAVFTVLYQFFYTNALVVGNVSLTVLIVNFGMVINVCVSYFAFNEPITVFRLFGIVITLISFVICTKFEKRASMGKKWLFFTVMSMLTFSGGSITQKFFGESSYKSETAAYVSGFYLIATVIAFLSALILKLNGHKKTFKMSWRCPVYAAGVGITLALFQYLYTYALGNIDGTFLFPAYTGGTIVLSTLSGVIIFKDKLNKRQLLGTVLGIVSIVIMNF